MRYLPLLLLAATPAMAEMSDAQQAAYDRLLPMMQAQAEGAAGEFLTTCVVEEASTRELKRLALGDAETPDPKMIETANKVMMRPEVMTCLTAKLSN